MIMRPSESDAQEAEHTLEEMILKFSNDARAPWERNKPNLNPVWTPRRSTLRYSPIRGGGFIWSMTANDQQIVAYYVVPLQAEPFGMVTAHGQARHNFQTKLVERKIHPTASPYIEWYTYEQRYMMDRV